MRLRRTAESKWSERGRRFILPLHTNKVGAGTNDFTTVLPDIFLLQEPPTFRRPYSSSTTKNGNATVKKLHAII
jgi:hypothetical protein